MEVHSTLEKHKLPSHQILPPPQPLSQEGRPAAARLGARSRLLESPLAASQHVTGGSMVSPLGLILGITLSVMLITILSYILIKWYQRGKCFERPSFASNLEKLRKLKSTELEFAPPFTVSGSLSSGGGAAYTRINEPNV
ncbi:small integral membrane protein 35 [Pleurodeles waltl]|uniref:small integral membrane protein 35 n=1 Tax=Pleurodeles waltl TaxID=8319 RepID=UPI0037098987